MVRQSYENRNLDFWQFDTRRQDMMSSNSSSDRSRRRRYSSPEDSRNRQKSHDHSTWTDSKIKELKSIRITIANRNKTSSAKFSILCQRHKEPNFEGSEENLPKYNEQRKIQIEIKRSIPKHLVSDSPVRRSIRSPDTFVMPRQKNEGQVSLLNHIDRVIELVTDNDNDTSDPDPDYEPAQKRDRIQEFQERLGTEPPPVPRSTEHDHREENDLQRPSYSTSNSRGFRGNYRGGGSFRGRGRAPGRRGNWTHFRGKNRGGFYKYPDRDRSPSDSNRMWKHDKFHELENEGF